MRFPLALSGRDSSERLCALSPRTEPSGERRSSDSEDDDEDENEDDWAGSWREFSQMDLALGTRDPRKGDIPVAPGWETGREVVGERNVALPVITHRPAETKRALKTPKASRSRRRGRRARTRARDIGGV